MNNMNRQTHTHITFSPKGLALWVLPALVVLLSACTKDGDTVYVVDEPEPDTRPVIYFVSREGSMGDLSYIDAIYRGVVKGATEANALQTALEIPNDTDLIAPILQLFIEQMSQEKRKALVVIANDALEPLLYQFKAQLDSLNENVSVLLTESQDTVLPVNTISFRQYGVCYQAGRVAARSLGTEFDNVCIANANPTERSITEMREGFTAGIEDGIDRGDPYGDKPVTNVYFSNTTGGFDMADSAYHMAKEELANNSTLLFPLCGGTTQGFLRYLRDVGSLLILGVDTDMQQYSDNVPFSVVKHIDTAVAKWIGNWAKGEANPKHWRLGLESGYTEIVVSDKYKEWIPQTDVDLFYEQALEKEKEYEDK